MDTDDCIDKVLSAARKENEAPLADDGPIVWVSFQTLEDGDDESASTNEMALAMIEDVQSENASLHKSMLEATELAKDMSDKLADLVQVHEVSVRDYEKQIATLEERLGRKDDDASMRLNSMKEENEILRAALIIGEEEEEGRSKSIKKKEEAHKEDMERVALEREALQEEMRALRQALATLTGCGDESCRLPMEDDEGTGLVNDSFDCEG